MQSRAKAKKGSIHYIYIILKKTHIRKYVAVPKKKQKVVAMSEAKVNQKHCKLRV